MPLFHRAGEDPEDWKLISKPLLPNSPHPIVNILNDLGEGVFQYVPGFVGPFFNKYVIGSMPVDISYITIDEAADKNSLQDSCVGITRTPKGKFKRRTGVRNLPLKWKLTPESVLCIPGKFTGEFSWVRTSNGFREPKKTNHKYPKNSIIKASRR